MARFSLSLSLSLVALALIPGALAQQVPICEAINSREILVDGFENGIGPNSDYACVQLRDVNGDLVSQDDDYLNPVSLPLVIPGNAQGCDLVVDTNGGLDGCTPQSGQDCKDLVVNQPFPVVFEFGYFNSSNECVPTHSFTYGGTLDDSSPDSFYEPNNSRDPDTIDYFIYYEEATDRLRYMPNNLGTLDVGRHPFRLESSNLPAGVYLVRMDTESPTGAGNTALTRRVSVVR